MERIRLQLVLVFITGCGGAQPASSDSTPLEPTVGTESKPPPKDYRHSPILNGIMKNEVNKPFSKLTFFIFHSDGEFDYAEIGNVVTEFRAGVSKAKAFPDPPVESEQGREVFATFLEGLDRDSTKLGEAVAQRDSRSMRSLIGRISKTCNNCHHFFRLDIADSPEQ